MRFVDNSIALIFISTIFSLNANALTHPSCVVEKPVEKPAEKTQGEVAQIEVSAKPVVKPTINFEHKDTLKVQTKEHREFIYQTLIQNDIPKQIAKYAYKLNFIERPTVESKNQAENTFTIDSYAKKFLQRIPRAREFLNDNITHFNDAEKKYGVDKEAIAALILIESNLGENKGKLNIMDALFTMSHPYNSSRNKFFTNELVSAFKLLSSQKHYFRNTLMGSWAGAMGYTQFIPSSVLSYAVDGDKDGKIDIINSKVDAIHSAANYLAQAKWELNKPVMKEISKEELKGVDLCKTIGQNFQEGKLFLAQVTPEERFFVTYGNYQTIIRWNRSFVFAYTVHLLSDELKKPAPEKITKEI